MIGYVWERRSLDVLGFVLLHPVRSFRFIRAAIAPFPIEVDS